MSRVVVHIDRLVLPHGADTRAVEAAVTQALRAALSRPGAAEALAAAGDRRSVDAGRTGAGPAGLGAAVARGITGRGA